jgi:succinate-semialdehyde dehydrogenase/glutarate-semialdehyde dehydrogenase
MSEPELFADLPGGLWIDGARRDGRGGERFDVRDPATGERLKSVASASAEDALDAVAAAASAQPAWAARAPRERGEILRRAHQALLARADAIAPVIVRENGKVLAEARGEVAYSAEFFRWFSEEAVRLAGSLATAPSGGVRQLVMRQPIGVALLVTPWNFPAAMAARKIAPALAAGCAVVLKPASQTPLTALLMAELLAEAGVPPGVVNVVPSRSSGAVVSAMLADPRVRKLSFTGSTEVGSLLLAQAAKRIVSSSMELGGNAPFLVFADADLDAAIEGAMLAKMRHNAQTCTAANRFYVEEPVRQEFTRRLAEAMARVRVGHGLEPGVELGPMIDAGARDKVTRLVDAALAGGAKLVTGGRVPAGPGFFYPPTVLGDVAPDSPILAEEIFGPVAPIVGFATDADAIRRANASEHGLVSYVYTRDLARGLRVAEALECGMVGLNKGLVSDPAAPFGGWKQSGLGREGAHEGILEYTETKYIATAW